MSPEHGEPSSHWRAAIALVLTAAATFALVGVAAVVAARKIAEHSALAEAERSAQTLSNVVFAPTLEAVLAGNRAARQQLDAAVLARKRDGGIVRVKVWSREGVILYSDEPTAVGARFPLGDDVREAIDNQASQASLSDLSADHNIFERQADVGDRLVRASVPLTAQSGQRLSLEIYSTTARVDTAVSHLIGRVVPFALGSLLLLVLVQLPVSVGLIRRAGRADTEHRRLLRSVLTASDRERHQIARDLHDGVVQDLAGVSYAMDAVQSSLPPDTPDQTRTSFAEATATIRGTVSSLRTVMVDVYPPDLTATGLPPALEELAGQLRRVGIDVTVSVDNGGDLSSDVTAAVYRCARECTSNIAKHSGASQAWIEVTRDRNQLRLRIADDGRGLPADVISGDPAHLGIRLLSDGIRDLGGDLVLRSRDGGGAEVLVRLPRNQPPRNP